MILLPWTRQPDGPLSINWDNPIARGLAFVQVGSNAIDVVTKLRASSGVGTPTQATGIEGKAYGYSASSHYYSGIVAADVATAYGVLIIARVTSFASFSGLLAHTSNLGTNTGWASWQDNGFGTLSFYGPGGSESTGISSATAADGKIHHFGGGLTGSSFSAYYDGRLSNSNGASGISVTTGTGYVKVAASRDIDNITGQIFLAAVWNRLPSAAEYRSLQNNPWQLFEPLRLYVAVTAAPAGLAANPARGGGAAINPIWGMAA